LNSFFKYNSAFAALVFLFTGIIGNNMRAASLFPAVGCCNQTQFAANWQADFFNQSLPEKQRRFTTFGFHKKIQPNIFSINKSYVKTLTQQTRPQQPHYNLTFEFEDKITLHLIAVIGNKMTIQKALYPLANNPGIN
jgi:hypothetical protein